ncbi:MAG: DEAD/DEAH box helicase family protein [Clostridia bacterium]
MTNFEYLKARGEYALFADAAIESEKVYMTAPSMCAVGCRKALELAVKWVYAADNTMVTPYKDNLQALIHEPSFRFAVDSQTWGKLPFIIKLGNLAVHTERAVLAGDALASLRGLFEFIQWLDYCYGADYQERIFDEALIPKEKVIVDTQKIKEQQSLLNEKNSEIERLQRMITDMSTQYTAEKGQHQQTRAFVAEDLSEYKTRKIYIDVDLKELGWQFVGAQADVWEEYEVEGMAGYPGQKGYVDYVLFGKDGLPLAVIEAKRTSKDPNIGRKQAALYADCLECKFGRRPMMFTSNGFDTYFWDDQTSPQRKVSGFFSKDTLQKLMTRRTERKDLDTIPISDHITDRYYQKEAIRAVCDNITRGFRKNLLVMATGTGKTRTASSLVDVLSRGGYITNVLFLADRTALVRQAKDDFKNYLPDLSLCNLLTSKDDAGARIVFSTYPTMLNAIDSARTKDGGRLFTPAHFDLIIIDESHRSIFKKYRAIFDYFDAITVGLTATPKTDVDRNTYDFFEMEHGIPTYAYDYDTAVHTDHVLVPYYNIEVSTRFLDEGITYDDLSDVDKERYEDDFIEDNGAMPAFIPSAKLNKFVFNQQTVDMVLQDLISKGIKVGGGDRIAKTIIFAQNKKHAEFILQRFNALYPHLRGAFAQRVICDDTYAQTVIDDFKQPAPPSPYCYEAEKEPHIVVSVDMMDTGIDVPHIGNLVFFKQVRSKTKFWQMIGRGTRLCKGMECVDSKDGAYTGKRRFFIFDYCGNFEFFRQHKDGFEGRDNASLSEMIFAKRIRIIMDLQDSTYADDEYQQWRKSLVELCHGQTTELNDQLVSVRLQRQYVEKYCSIAAYTCLAETEKSELTEHIAPLVYMDDADELAKRFDNFMYGLILASIEALPGTERAQKELCGIAFLLEKKTSIPQVKEKLPVIQSINTDAFWTDANVLQFEHVRAELRALIKFLDGGDPKKTVFTNLMDIITNVQEGVELESAYDFEDFRIKVNRYVAENGDMLAIHKLTHNIPLTAMDYQSLEHALTVELGSREDYQREFGETPFGLLIRKIAKLDHQAAMDAFSAFINDQSLNQLQIAFVRKVINHVEQNGYMEDVKELLLPPFDKPLSFIKLFDAKRQKELMRAIALVKQNAESIIA